MDTSTEFYAMLAIFAIAIALVGIIDNRRKRGTESNRDQRKRELFGSARTGSGRFAGDTLGVRHDGPPAHRRGTD